MSQALHTASTGINAGQSQINVIANNVANINTTAFKAANMTFETLYSNTTYYDVPLSIEIQDFVNTVCIYYNISPVIVYQIIYLAN